MRKATFICWQCQTSYRSTVSTYNRKCSDCGRALRSISPKAEIPKKSDKKGWIALRNDLLKRRDQREVKDREHKRNLINYYKQQIINLESRPKNKDRQKQIHNFQKKLSQLLKVPK